MYDPLDLSFFRWHAHLLINLRLVTGPEKGGCVPHQLCPQPAVWLHNLSPWVALIRCFTEITYLTIFLAVKPCNRDHSSRRLGTQALCYLCDLENKSLVMRQVSLSVTSILSFLKRSLVVFHLSKMMAEHGNMFISIVHALKTLSPCSMEIHCSSPWHL